MLFCLYVIFGHGLMSLSTTGTVSTLHPYSTFAQLDVILESRCYVSLECIYAKRRPASRQIEPGEITVGRSEGDE